MPFFCPRVLPGVPLIAMIELRRVYKRYHERIGPPEPGLDRTVLDGIDLVVEPGEVVLVSGPCGSGKSTLLELLYGACFADSGTVAVFNRAISRLRRSSISLLRRCVGVIPQTPAFLWDRSVMGNVALALEVRAEHRAMIREKVLDSLERVGLADRATVPLRQLSMGERQWVAMARALVGEPNVLIADEPSTSFDTSGRGRLVDILEAERERGVAAIVATNDYKLLCAGARKSWRHVELRAGLLEVIADRRIDALGLDNKPDVPGASSEDDANVLPFPMSVSAGGAAE